MLAHQLDPPTLEPRHLARVVEVVDDLVAPRKRGGHVELAGHGLGGAGDATDLGQHLAGRSSALEGMHA